MIKLMQPYQRTDSPDLHVLFALRELSNTDKHRLPLTMLCAISEHEQPTIDLEYDDIELPAQYGVVVTKPLADGDEVMFVDNVTVTGPNPYLKPKGELPLEVAFGEAGTTMAACCRSASTCT
jgi:hypothetical protein